MTTEFRSFEDMSPEELQHEREQHWVIVKSDTSWWIYRNHSPFMNSRTEAEAISTLSKNGITTYGVDRSQRATTVDDWNNYRRDKMRVMSGKTPSIARKVWRWLGGDAA